MSVPLQGSEQSPPRSTSASRTRRKGHRDPPPRQVTTRQTKEKTQACSEAGSPPAKGRQGRKRKMKTAANAAQSLSRSRPRFNLEKPEEAEQGSFCLIHSCLLFSDFLYFRNLSCLQSKHNKLQCHEFLPNPFFSSFYYFFYYLCLSAKSSLVLLLFPTKKMCLQNCR